MSLVISRLSWFACHTLALEFAVSANRNSAHITISSLYLCHFLFLGIPSRNIESATKPAVFDHIVWSHQFDPNGVVLILWPSLEDTVHNIPCFNQYGSPFRYRNTFEKVKCYTVPRVIDHRFDTTTATLRARLHISGSRIRGV